MNRLRKFFAKRKPQQVTSVSRVGKNVDQTLRHSRSMPEWRYDAAVAEEFRATGILNESRMRKHSNIPPVPKYMRVLGIPLQVDYPTTNDHSREQTKQYGNFTKGESRRRANTAAHNLDSDRQRKKIMPPINVPFPTEHRNVIADNPDFVAGNVDFVRQRSVSQHTRTASARHGYDTTRVERQWKGKGRAPPENTNASSSNAYEDDLAKAIAASLKPEYNEPTIPHPDLSFDLAKAIAESLKPEYNQVTTRPAESSSRYENVGQAGPSNCGVGVCGAFNRPTSKEEHIRRVRSQPGLAENSTSRRPELVPKPRKVSLRTLARELPPRLPPPPDLGPFPPGIHLTVKIPTGTRK